MGLDRTNPVCNSRIRTNKELTDARQSARNDHHCRPDFPVRIRLAVLPGGFGRRHTQITAWLDENGGSDGWALTPSGIRGVLNDAISIYFADATLASAFVARWCVGSKVEVAGGVFPSARGRTGAAGRSGTGQDAVTAGETWGWGVNGYRPPGVADIENAFGVWRLERRSAVYHRAAAARARMLRAEATTRWLKEHLADAVVRHEQIAAAIERASEPDAAIT